MNDLRNITRNHGRLALLLIVCALFVKAVVPSGYMIGGASRLLAVEICADGLGGKMIRQIEIPTESGNREPTGRKDKTDATCAFSSHMMAGVAGTDAGLLALALAFLLVLGFAPVSVPHALGAAYLRPPLRGPPGAV